MKKKTGVYLILCATTGGVYIGSSRDIGQRIIRHKGDLKYNKHHNSHLQAAYNKYGKESFSYSLIEECAKEELLVREKYWIDYYDCMNNGFNQQDPLNPKIHTREKPIISRTKVTKIVIGINKEGEVREFESGTSASLELGIPYKKIMNILAYWRGKSGIKSLKGWIFIYKEDYDSDRDYVSELLTRKIGIPSQDVGKKIRETRLANRKYDPVIVVDSSGNSRCFDNLNDAIDTLSLNRGGAFRALKSGISHRGYKIVKGLFI